MRLTNFVRTLVLGGLICSGVSAGEIRISAEFKVFSDVSFPSNSPDWDPEWLVRTDTEGKTIYVLEKVLLKEELPYLSRLGDAYLALNEQGVLSFGLYHGEKAGETQTSFRIPQIGGKFLINEIPYLIQGIGGDYDAETWKFAGRVTLKIN